MNEPFGDDVLEFEAAAAAALFSILASMADFIFFRTVGDMTNVRRFNIDVKSPPYCH